MSPTQITSNSTTTIVPVMLFLVNHLCCLLALLLSFNPQLTCSPPSSPTLDSPFLCHPRQSHALLLLKSTFTIDSFASSCGALVSRPKTESWKEGTDCCSSWDGVTCDRVTGHVTGLDLSCSQLQGTIHSNSSLFSSHIAPYLRTLNLASNDFSGSNMTSEFGVKFGSSLTHLNLSDSGISGNIPYEISQLSNLVSLDLSLNFGLGAEHDRVVERIAQNLTQLRVLHLDVVNMSSVHASSLMNLSFSLTSLSLSGCEMQGQFPGSFLLRPNLQELDLSGNNFNPITSLPNFNSTTHTPNNLWFLDLSDTTFSASTSTHFLDFVGNLRSLRNLYLRASNLSGSIPSSFGNLTKLTHLHLRDNHLNGPIPTSFSKLTHLVDLLMKNNELDGPLPSCLFVLPSLKSVDLSYNKLHGQIPTSLMNLNNLVNLDLSNNNISSPTSTGTNLSYSLPSFQYLDLSGCNLTRVPVFIKSFTNLTYLDISKNKVQGSIPEWIYDVGKDTLSVIDLSENLLTSVVRQFHWKNVKYVDFHSNLLQGLLPIPPPTTQFFSVSNNNLFGEVSSVFCNLSSLQVLELSHNHFTGSIPLCLGNLSGLSVLNLGMNNLHGVIPNTFAKHNGLNFLVLNGNKLRGRVPRSLANCRSLKILDLGSNMIEDTIPRWVETLSGLEVLVLRSNKFFGSLNGFENKTLFPVLRILDLSDNNFSGGLPIKLISNLNSMKKVDEQLGNGSLYMDLSSNGYSEWYYSTTITVGGIQIVYVQNTLTTLEMYYSMMLIVKGFEREYVKILTKLVTIDLSGNKFEGHIPQVIGELISLKGLNLSHNLLTGHIPSSMGNLSSLEWLDLSSNRLSGHIPKELADLTFLAVLNVSYNQLDGPVPQGKQFNTFGNGSYRDNLALCGFPLSKACGPNLEPPLVANDDESSSDSESGFSWEGAVIGYGCGIVFGLSMGYLGFTTRWPKWFVRMVEGKKQYGRVGNRSKRHGSTRT